MHPRLFIPALLILLACLVMLVVWPSPRPETERPSQPTPVASNGWVLRMGYNMSPRSAMHQAASRLAEQLEIQSGGRVRIELYHSGELGNDHQMLEMARRGVLDLVLIPTAKLSASIPEMQYPDLPFYFPAKDDLYAMLDGEPGRRLLERMRRIGLVGVTFWGNGFKQFTANHPLLTPEDFAGQKFRIMKSRLLQEQFRLLNAQAIPIEFQQVSTALKDGAVDGQENPLVAISQMGIYKVQSDLTLSNHGYLAYALAVSEDTLAKLPNDLQALLLQLARAQTPWQREETERQEAEYLREIAAAGVHIHELSAEQRQAFRQRLRPLAHRFESVIGADLLALTDEYLLQRYPDDVQFILGVDVDLTGGSADVGREIRRGVALALSDLQGTQQGVRMLTRDNLGQLSRAVVNIDRFGADARVLGVIGGTKSEPLAAQLPHLQRLQLPLITPFASESLFYSDPPVSDWLFNVAPGNRALAEFISSQIARQGIKRVGVVVEKGRWGDDFAALLGQALAQTHCDLIGQHVVNPSSGTIHPERLLALAAESDMLVLGLRSQEGKQVLSALAGAGSKVGLLTTWGLPYDGPLTLQSVVKGGNSPRMPQLIAAYRQRYGEEPLLLSILAQAYDSAHLMVSALQQTQATGTEMLRLQIRDQLESMPAWKGMVRNYAPAFTAHRHSALDQSDFRLITKGL